MRKRAISLALVLALTLSLTACGGTQAATMKLAKLDGSVSVSDGEGKDVTPVENLGLYSGYNVNTAGESYAWVNLDDVKLTKMDENTEIEITKDGKKLEISVLSGSLFFNVTEPLADDETLDIRTSSMVVGIRGTCGWVTQDAAALLEGTVEVTSGEQSVTITAGEMAYLTEYGDIEVMSFHQESIPDFVAEEPLDEDILNEIPAVYPLTVLTRQTIHDSVGEFWETCDYIYDEEGYILRYELQSYSLGGDGEIHESPPWITTYSYDGEGHCLCTQSDPYGDGDDYTHDWICKPGNAQPNYGVAGLDIHSYIFTGPMIEVDYDRRSEIGPDGRLDISDFGDWPEGLYAIYTMDENGYPVYIETYAPDGNLNGTATLEWAVIDP